ncbi:hypothetical protein FNV43_RR02550 [Rhamnella rubrinervis]|uniref:Uncharacterized protein n=1 Tax=Rhamnella rubrinervis TaxID=2594499 RepID=A0A8K0HTN7_9ROSA|nr:hypothetical protein FNV43_RR02550 [Rhamnella rubrinervis]
MPRTICRGYPYIRGSRRFGRCLGTICRGISVYNKRAPLGQFGRCLGKFGRGVSVYNRRAPSANLADASANLAEVAFIYLVFHRHTVSRRIIQRCGGYCSSHVISNSQSGTQSYLISYEKGIDQFEASFLDMDQFEANIDWASEMSDRPVIIMRGKMRSDHHLGHQGHFFPNWCRYISVNNNECALVVKVDIKWQAYYLSTSAIKMTPKSWFQIKNARPLAVLFRISDGQRILHSSSGSNAGLNSIRMTGKRIPHSSDK